MKISDSDLIKRPCERQLKYWHAKYRTKEYEHYRRQDELIDFLFRTKYPKNTDWKIVLMKCTLLNDFYSTVIFNIYDVHKKMMTISDIDRGIKEGDVKLVEKIGKCGMGRSIYSFATKYCCLHNWEGFPIYDNIVGFLLHWMNRSGFHFTERKTSYSALRDFSNYKGVIDDFRDSFGLHKYSYREIDRYLWIMGKSVVGR